MRFIQLSPEDIVKNWEIVSYAYANTAMLTNKSNMNKMLQNTLLDLLSGRKICFALTTDDYKIKALVGLKIMYPENNVEPVKSIIIGPVYGFEVATAEEKEFAMNKIRQYKDNIKAESIYFLSAVPIAWNLAERMGMQFVAKVYVDQNLQQKEVDHE